MQLDRDPAHRFVIRSFRPGVLCVGNRDITTPVILAPPDRITTWEAPELPELSIDDFSIALEREPEIILFGTGARQRFPDPALNMHILRIGVGFEVMDTAAACRTFNVLIGEGRHVCAALLLR